MLRSHAIRELNKKYDGRGQHPNCHKNLGALPKWKNRPTIAIRIPEVFKEDLLARAKQLDEGKLEPDSQIENLKQRLQSILEMPVRSSQGTEALKLAIQEILKTL